MKDLALIKRGLAFNYLHLLVAFAWVVLLTPVILKYLGPTEYGFWAILTSIVTYFTLFNFGLNIATTKYTAEYRAVNDQKSLNVLVSTTMVAIVIISFILLFICFISSPGIPHIFSLDAKIHRVGKIAFIITGFNVVLMLFGGLLGNVIYGLHRVDVWKALRSVQLFSCGIFTLAFLVFGWGITGVCLAMTVSQLVVVMLFWRFLSHNHREIVIHPRLASLEKLKEIAPYSIRSFVMGICNALLHYTDYIVIGIILGSAMVTPYEIIYKLCFFATYLFSVISSTLFPNFAELYAKNDIDRLRNVYLFVVKLSLVMMVPVALGLLFFGSYFIDLWVGKGNFAGYPVLLVLVAMSILHAIGGPTVVMLQAVGKIKWITYSDIVNSLLNLTLSIILVREIGLLGVALGTIVASSLTSSWVLIYLMRKHIEIPVLRYFRTAIIPPLFVGVVTGGLWWIIIKHLPRPDQWLYLILDSTLLLILFVVLYVALGANKVELRQYWGLIFKNGFGTRKKGLISG